LAIVFVICVSKWKGNIICFSRKC